MEFDNFILPGIGIVAAIFWSLQFFNIGKKAEIYLPIQTASKINKFFKVFVFTLGFVGWGFISFSLSGPKEPVGFAKNTIKVNDIFFVVDVSRSMLAEDFYPNRLEASKKKIKEFVALRPTDRIGIVMFSEKAFTLLPLTTDLKLVEQAVEDINVGFLGSGTNIGDALGLATGRAEQSLADSKIIVLLTDGVSNVGTMTPLQAAESAKKFGIKVYTIGVGGRDTTRIPLPGTTFGRKRYQSIPGGSIDLETLEKISKITNAKAYVAGDEDALENVFTEINELEKTEIEHSGRIVYTYHYWKYLMTGFLLFLFSESLNRFALRRVV